MSKRRERQQEPEPYDASDEAAVKEGERQAKEKREAELADIRVLSESPEFRRYIWRLLEFTGLFRSSFTGNSTTFFNEGQRNVGLHIFDDLMTADPQLYGQMVEEQKGQSDG